MGLRFTVKPTDRVGIYAQGSLGVARVNEDVLYIYGYRNADQWGLYFGGELGLEWYQVNPHYALALHGGMRNYQAVLGRDQTPPVSRHWRGPAVLRCATCSEPGSVQRRDLLRRSLVARERGAQRNAGLLADAAAQRLDEGEVHPRSRQPGGEPDEHSRANGTTYRARGRRDGSRLDGARHALGTGRAGSDCFRISSARW